MGAPGYPEDTSWQVEETHPILEVPAARVNRAPRGLVCLTFSHHADLEAQKRGQPTHRTANLLKFPASFACPLCLGHHL